MQHKRRRHPALGLIVVVVILVVAAGALAVANPQAPTQPVEKQLDAKTFLGAKN